MSDENERLRALRMKWVFEDYPELAKAFRKADYWVRPDGSVQMQCHVDDLATLQPALRAYVKAQGVPLEELPADAPRPPRPTGPALTMHEAGRVSRANAGME